jgi:transposase
MAYGRKTGGRQKGSANKATIEREELIAESAQRSTDGLTQEQIATMTPLDVMLHAMKLEVANAQWRLAAVFAEKAAPYIHPRLASEVHRISTDDSKRNTEELQRELADLDRAAEIARKAGTVEERVPEQSHGVVH